MSDVSGVEDISEHEQLARVQDILGKDRPRSEGGRFAAAERVEEAPQGGADVQEQPTEIEQADEPVDTGSETTTGDVNEREAEPAKPTIEPPLYWSAAEKEKFRALPPDTQRYIADRDRERDAFVHTKAQETAAERRAAAAERAQYANALGSFLQAIGNEPEPNWVQLAQTQTPQQYNQVRAQWDERNRLVAKAQQDYATVQQQDQVERQRTFVATRAEEEGKLFDKMPTWCDEEIRKKDLSTTKAHLIKHYGYTAQEIDQAVDHRAVLLADKARRYDEIMAAKPADKIVRPQPTSLRPGTQVAQPQTDKRISALHETARRTGKPDDALAAVLASLQRGKR